MGLTQSMASRASQSGCYYFPINGPVTWLALARLAEPALCLLLESAETELHCSPGWVAQLVTASSRFSRGQVTLTQS